MNFSKLNTLSTLTRVTGKHETANVAGLITQEGEYLGRHQPLPSDPTYSAKKQNILLYHGLTLQFLR